MLKDINQSVQNFKDGVEGSLEDATKDINQSLRGCQGSVEDILQECRGQL